MVPYFRLGFDFRWKLGIFPFTTEFQNGSEDHTTSYPIGTRGSFDGDRAAEA